MLLSCFLPQILSVQFMKNAGYIAGILNTTFKLILKGKEEPKNFGDYLCSVKYHYL